MRITRNPKQSDRPSWTKDLFALPLGEENAIYAELEELNNVSSLRSGRFKLLYPHIKIRINQVIKNGKKVLMIWKPIPQPKIK